MRAELEAVYAQTAREISARAPACWASGRCCNFKEAGHRLYVTGLEAAYTVVRSPLTPGTLQLTPHSLAESLARGGCPFQAANLCSAHSIKPLGCRVYFCDQSAQHWQQDLSERMLTCIRAIHERHDIPYAYAEWGALLGDILRAAHDQ